jgi:succinate-semialdehyde dehydrogenase/glutarate-semialdehyde dehydrogenase
VTIAKSNEKAIVLANKSQYGLAASVWTSDVKTAKLFIPKLNTGNVFINSIVKSDARLPFGGVKKSGYGRELSDFGLKEFVNIKSVFIQ